MRRHTEADWDDIQPLSAEGAVPNIDSAADGNHLVVWDEGGTGGAGRLRSRFLDAVGQPAGDVFTVTENTPWVGGPPGVAISPGGRALYAWEDFDTGRILARWWDEPVAPMARKSWGSLKGLWR